MTDQLTLTLVDGVDGWNPLWAAYAATQGRTPAEQVACGRLWEFVQWVDARWREWDEANGTVGRLGRSDDELAAFVAWVVGAA